MPQGSQFRRLPASYNYLSMMNFQQLGTLPKHEKLQELVAKRIFLASSLRYTAPGTTETKGLKKLTVTSKQRIRDNKLKNKE